MAERKKQSVERKWRRTFSVSVMQGVCWGKITGDDNDQGACSLCVDICPEVFEKPYPNQCAQVRPDVDLAPYLVRIRRAVRMCPAQAILAKQLGTKADGKAMGFKWLPAIDETRCTGCGACVDACGPRCLKVQSGIAVLTDPNICGSEEHCIAPCQEKAIRMDWVETAGDKRVGKWR